MVGSVLLWKAGKRSGEGFRFAKRGRDVILFSLYSGQKTRKECYFMTDFRSDRAAALQTARFCGVCTAEKCRREGGLYFGRKGGAQKTFGRGQSFDLREDCRERIRRVL